MSPTPTDTPGDAKFVGLLTSPPNYYDEGFDFALDLMQETVGANAVCVYTHQRMTPAASPAGALVDHGKPRDPNRENDAFTWVQVNEDYYRNTPLRHQVNPADSHYAGKDILADLEAPAAKRGIKVYSRILEGWRFPNRPGFFQVHEQDVQGRIRRRPCYNHPDYIAFWLATCEDMFRTYPYLAGIYWGSENHGPLTEALGGRSVGCFCPHCRAIARDKGIDVDRTIRGFRELASIVTQLKQEKKLRDGAFVTLMRVLWKYPEILAWEMLWVESYHRIPRLMSGLMKSIRPEAELGFHADHGVAGIHLFKRIAFDYAELAEIYDWIKPCNYLAATSHRLGHNVRELNRSVFADLDPQQTLEFVFKAHGLDPAEQPTLEQMTNDDARLSPAYTTREISRALAGVNGRAKIYAGNAFGIPVHQKKFEEDPELTYLDACAALDAGADGFLISREYQEMEVENLKAVGRALNRK